jgi:hypothetical protein
MAFASKEAQSNQPALKLQAVLLHPGIFFYQWRIDLAEWIFYSALNYVFVGVPVMFVRSFAVYSVAALFAVSAALPAQAESLVAPAGALPVAETSRAPSAAPSSDKPLLLVRYNKRNVHFQDSLRKAVSAVRRVQPNASYRVISKVPQVEGETRNKSIKQEAQTRTRAVVKEMTMLGIDATNINVTVEPSPSVRYQTIEVFVD